MMTGVPGDPGPFLDESGTIQLRRVGTGRHDAEVDRSMVRHRASVARCGSAPPSRPIIGRSCSRIRPASGQAMLSNLDDGSLRPLHGAHSSQMLGGAFSPDGSLVATSGDDGSTRLWNATTGSLVDTLVGHAGRVCAPAFSMLGGRLTLDTAASTAR